MVSVIDEEGNLFGVVNIIDALVVLAVIAVVVAGIGLVLSGDDNSTNEEQPTGPNTTTIDIEFRSEQLEPYVVSAINEGPVPGENITAIENKTVSQSRVVTQNQSGNLSIQTHPTLQTVTLQLGLNVTVSNGEYLYNGEPVEIGQTLTLDLGPTTISGEIRVIESGNSTSN